MKEVDFMKLVEADYGPTGTPERDALDQEMRELEAQIEIGRIIREARSASGLTQEELALKVGMNKSQISKIETGKINMTFAKALRILSNIGGGFIHSNLGGEMNFA